MLKAFGDSVTGAILPVFILTVFVYGCAQRPVAVVNGRPVDGKAFAQHLKEKLGEQRTQRDLVNDRQLRSEVVNELIIEQLILEEAGRHGISASDGEAKAAAEQRRRTMGDEAFERYLKERGMTGDDFLRNTRELIIMERFRAALAMQHPVTEEELRDYYRNSPRPFIRLPKSLLRVVEMRSDEEARSAIREMRRDKIDFDVMASRLAAEGKASVTDYGWARPGYFSAPVAQAIMNLGIGQYGGPYEGKNGFLLIRVKDREKETIAPFAEVKEEIRGMLHEERSRNVFAMWLDQKRRSSTIEVHLN